jgi:hypothetical protein
VTTVRDPEPAEQAAASACAARFGVPSLDRAGRSLASLAVEHGAEALLVLGARRAALFLDGEERTWQAGMGELRLRRLLRGEPARGQHTADPFLAAADLRPGDAVLDATLGLGMDALVAAGAVGERGRVLGAEASTPLAALVAEGLVRHPAPAARRVEVVASDAGELLARLPERSFDVVAFDPMFRHARAQGAGFDLVRRLGDPRPLPVETLARARRVCRRWVVVKDGTPGWDLARLGLAPLPSARGAHRLYARLPPA